VTAGSPSGPGTRAWAAIRPLGGAGHRRSASFDTLRPGGPVVDLTGEILVMHGNPVLRVIALCAVVTVALAGCGSGGDDDTGGDAVKQPAGGWPQPENGQLTDKMCGLLTQADYKTVGQKQLQPLEPASQQKVSSNYVSCSGMLGDWLTLDLQPTAEAAKVRYQQQLASQKESVAGEKLPSILAEGVLTTADESWFDYGATAAVTEPDSFELQFRRGSLVASLVLDQAGGMKEQQAQAALVKLAGIVLERIPEVGKTDTGTTPMIRFEANGKGKAVEILYQTSDHKSTKLEQVQLPWSVEVPMADHGEFDATLHLTVRADPRAYPPVGMSCAVSVRGKVVVQDQQLGFAICQGMVSVR
jgi:hypothetical protein